MDSIIKFNFDGLSSVANNCIDKISSATGYFFNRKTPKRIALNTYIDEISKSDLSPSTKAVLIYNSKRDIKEMANQKAIVDKAMQLVSDKAEPDAVEDDWLLSFFDKARLVSDEDFQGIWARILAGEFEKPGSYSIRTLEKLKGLSKIDAEVFAKVAKYSLTNNNSCFVFFDKKLTDRFFFFDDILRLEECGLITAQLLSLNIFHSVDEIDETCVNNSKLMAIIQRNKNDRQRSELIVPCFAFTNSGKELLHAIDVDNDEALFMIFAKSISVRYRGLFSILVHRIIEIKDDGSIEYDANKLLTR